MRKERFKKKKKVKAKEIQDERESEKNRQKVEKSQAMWGQRVGKGFSSTQKETAWSRAREGFL